MGIRVRAAVAAALLAALSWGLVPTAHAVPSVATTQVRAVSPVDDTNQLAAGFTINHRYGNASCESGSPTVGKAYECFTPQSSEGIYAACWVEADPHFVLCLDKPWQHKVVRLHVTRGFGDSTGFVKAKRPWGLRLANGYRCLVILGPVHVTHGKPVNYYCNHSRALAGRISKRHDAWTVRTYRKVRRPGRPTEFRATGTRQIAIAWNGGPSQHD
jgi:hypothetical protein